MPVPSRARPAPPVAAACFHGGASFRAIGEGFDDLSRRHRVIRADVLDAWFPPAPAVVAALREELPWLLQAAPPAEADGVVRAIASARGLPEESLLVGAGSSALIFLALRQWLRPGRKVLLLDPTYGEYEHVARQVCGASVERFFLSPEESFRIDLPRLAARVARGIDLLVLVHPNNPTGSVLPRAELVAFLADLPRRTRVWIDEAYVDYLGPDVTVEKLAAESSRVVVCKSLSKVYALSGARAAYLSAAPEVLAELRPLVPPWAVSLPAQVAAVHALREVGYYAGRWSETHRLRDELVASLQTLVEPALPGLAVVPGTANSVLIRLADTGPDAAELMERCAARGLYLRGLASMTSTHGRLADRWVRLAVQDAPTQVRMVATLTAAFAEAGVRCAPRAAAPPYALAAGSRAASNSGIQQQTRLRSP